MCTCRWAVNRAQQLEVRGLLASVEGPGVDPEDLGRAAEAQVKQVGLGHWLR